MFLTMRQGTEAIYHNSTQAKSGTRPKSGCVRFRVAFFLSFLAKQKRKSTLLKTEPMAANLKNDNVS